MQQHEATHFKFITKMGYDLQVSNLCLTNLKCISYLNNFKISQKCQVQWIIHTKFDAMIHKISCERMRKGYMVLCAIHSYYLLHKHLYLCSIKNNHHSMHKEIPCKCLILMFAIEFSNYFRHGFSSKLYYKNEV